MELAIVIIDSLILAGILYGIHKLKQKRREKLLAQKGKEYNMEIFHDTSITEKAEMLKSELEMQSLKKDMESDSIQTNELGFKNYDDGNDLMRQKIKNNKPSENLAINTASSIEAGGLNTANTMTNYLNM